MDLYIANPSHQKIKFTFRVLGNPGVRQIPIGPGRQEKVHSGPSEEIDDIIRQHEQYGLIDAREAAKRGRGYVGACYSVDAPIKVETYRVIGTHNFDVLADRGKEMRKNMALVAANQLRDNANQLPGVEVNVGTTEFSMRDINESGDTVDLYEQNMVTETADRGRQRRRG